MFEYIFEKLLTNYPAIGVYTAIAGGIIFITYKATRFYIETKSATDKIPRMEMLLEKIDRGLSALNNALVEKNVIKHSYHPHR